MKSKRGRPSLSPDEPTERVTIRLPSTYVERLRKLGNGNVSDGLRELLRRSKASRQK